MLSPVYRILFSNFPFRRNILPVVQIQQRSSVHVISMTSSANWVDEKKRILKLPLEEKRKFYKCTDYITLPSVDAWDHYVKMHDLSSKKHNLDDEDYFQNVPMSPDRNIELAGKVALFQGDITKLEVDAIVNAANSRLKAGGGVDGAIHRAAGPLLQKECDTLGGCPTGEARITGGYNLPAKYVIHTVGPQDGSVPHLESCYKNSLKLLLEADLQSIAFPCISTGIYGFPNRLAAHIALRAARKFLEENPRLNKIIFCTFLPIDVDIYETLMKMYFPVL